MSDPSRYSYLVLWAMLLKLLTNSPKQMPSMSTTLLLGLLQDRIYAKDYLERSARSMCPFIASVPFPAHLQSLC